MSPNHDHPYPRVGCAVFILKHDKFPMCLRQGAHGAGTWGLPGGKLQLGETWEDAVRREAREECGLELENVRFLAVTNDIFKDEKLHYITIFMTADWVSGEPQVLEPEKCQEWRWFSYENLPANVMLPLDNLKKQLQRLPLSPGQ